MNRTLCGLAPLLAAALLVFAPPAFAQDSPEALQQVFLDALLANDAEALAACYTPDATNFPVGAMMGHGPESVRQDWAGFFEQWRVLEASLHDGQIVREGDLAVAWGLFTLLAEPVGGGEPVEMKGRYLDAARPVDGRWLYIVDHASVPATE